MGLALEKRMPDPEWVNSGANPVHGLDLLGLRLPVQALGNALFNGVTTITPSVRYLSVLCWTIHVYGNARRPDSWEDFTEFAARVEAAVAVGNMLVDDTIVGIIGAKEARKLAGAEDDPIALRKLVAQLATSIYSNPSEQLGLTVSRGDSFPGLTRERGLVLAGVFSDSSMSTALGRDLSKGSAPESVPRNALEEFGQIVAFDRISDAETEVLIEAILPLVPRPEERPRLQTYTCLLALAEQLGAIPSEKDLFNEAEMLDRTLPEAFESVLDGWLRYRVRDLIAYVHEVAFREIVVTLQQESKRLSGAIKASQVVELLMASADDQTDALKDLLLVGSGEDVRALSFRTLNERCINAVGSGVSQRGLQRGDGQLRESRIIEIAASASAGVLAMVPVSWILAVWRSDSWENYSEDSFEGGTAGWSRIGLFEVIRPAVQRYLEEDWSLQEVIADLTYRTAEQHLDIAWSRMATDSARDVAVFLSDADSWHARSRDFSPGRTASRISQATNWLRQLGLLDDGLTPAGKVVLKRCLETMQSWEKS